MLILRRRACLIHCAMLIPALTSLGGPLAVAEGSKTLTGDWGGVRSELHDRGIDLTFSYGTETATNPHGGNENEWAYTDQLVFGVKLDLDKVTGLPGGKVQLTVTDRNGTDLVTKADLHDTQLVQEVYGRGQTWRLTQFWYDQAWLDGRIDWKVGRVTDGEDFAAFSCNFQNLTFCGAPPGNLRGDYWYNWPVSQWGTRLKIEPSSDTYVQLGIYQVNPTYIDDNWAEANGLFPDNPSGTTGALIPLELAWTPSPHGLPGTYKVGAWVDTSNLDDVYYDIDHQPLVLTGAAPLRRHSSSGVYLNVEQKVNGSGSPRGASVFLNVTQTDRETASLLDRQIAVGVQYNGPFPQRPADTLGLGIGQNHINSRVAEGERLQNEFTGTRLPIQGTEYVVELFYGWAPWGFLTLRPNIQYVRHPDGTAVYGDQLILGLKTALNF